MREFLSYLEETITAMPNEELEKMYSQKWKLSIGDRMVEIPFDAVSYNAFVAALEIIIKED